MIAFFLDLVEQVPEATPGAMAKAMERASAHALAPPPIFTYRKRCPPTPERMVVLQELMQRRRAKSHSLMVEPHGATCRRPAPTGAVGAG